VKKTVFILGILLSFPVLADTIRQNTNALGFGQGNASINQTFAASKVVAQTPQFGNSASSGAVPIFSGATSTADQLVGPYEDALVAIGIDRSVYLTKALLDEMELGVREEREFAFVSYAPVSDYIVAKSLSGKKAAVGKHQVFVSPKFTNRLNIKGSYLGLLYVSSLPGVSATDQDLKNAVTAFTVENILPYFWGKNIYLVKVPNGSGINVGVKTESLAKSLFVSIASLFGEASGGIGGSLTQNNGDTRYSTTLGEQILVFVENGLLPIHLDFMTPQNLATTQENAVEQPSQNTQKVIVEINVKTNEGIPLQQKASYVTQKRRRISTPYTISE
jgi:hypothetical protein